MQRAALDAGRHLDDDRHGVPPRRLTIPRVHAHRELGRALADLGGFAEAQDDFDAALALAGDDPVELAHVHYARNHAYVVEGRTADALDAAREAARLFDAAGDRLGHAAALTDVGWYRARLGDAEQALVHLWQALDLHRELGNAGYEAHTLYCLAETHGLLGEHAEALACDRRALAIFHDFGDRYAEASTLAHVAAVHRAAGDEPAARDAEREARALLDALDPAAADQVEVLLRDLTQPGTLRRPPDGSRRSLN